jgi:UDP:flavonoid glycosyltransferase YjiC (YdhE family)
MRALMVPVGVGYGTTARNLAVAHELRKRGHEAVFAAGEPLKSIIEPYGYEVRVVTDFQIDPHSRYTIPEQTFQLQTADRFLERLLKDLLQAIQDYRSDVVVFSNNNMASLAAGKSNIPSVSLLHPSILEMKSLTMFHAAYLKWRTWGDMVKAARPPRKVVSGLFGDLSFIPSLPQLVKWPLLLSPEIYAAKDSAQAVGALTVTPINELPSRDELRHEHDAGGGPLIYATIGGAVFDRSFLEEIVEAFNRTGYRVIITAGSQTPPEVTARLSSKKITVARYLPEGIRLIKACDLLVWHGGHETMMEAVATGRPGVVIPQHLDQRTNAELFAKSGAGIMIPRRHLNPQTLLAAVDTVLTDPSYRHQAEHLRMQSEALGGARRIVDEMENLH